MRAKTLRAITDLDFSFEHSLVKIIVNRNCPEIKLAGLNIGPFEEGNEYEVPFWIAQELEKAGIARFVKKNVWIQLNSTKSSGQNAFKLLGKYQNCQKISIQNFGDTSRS